MTFSNNMFVTFTKNKFQVKDYMYFYFESRSFNVFTEATKSVYLLLLRLVILEVESYEQLTIPIF